MIKQRIEELNERFASKLPKYFKVDERAVWGFSDGEKKIIVNGLTACLKQLDAHPQLLRAQEARIATRKKNDSEWVDSIEIIESLWDRNSTCVTMADKYMDVLPYDNDPNKPYYFEEIRNIALNFCQYVKDFQAQLDILDVKGARSILDEIIEYEWLDIHATNPKRRPSDYYVSSTLDKSICDIKNKFGGNQFWSIVGMAEPLFITPSQKLPTICTFNESLQRVKFLKQFIENNDGYKVFYVKGEPYKRELTVQLLYRLTWFSTELDVNAEVNNGRGYVDYKISLGSRDKTLVEFKLASNSKLKKNLENQVKVYEKANETEKSIKVILYFDDNERQKVFRVLGELGLVEGDDLVVIDAVDNKDSASNV